MIFLATAWSYIKRYWGIAVLIVGAVAGLFLYRAERSSFTDRLQQLQDSHDKELEQIRAARDEEQRQHLANEKRLEDALSAVQAQYDAAQRNLDDKKRKEVADIVKQFADDPEGLARRLSESTGFVIVLPNSLS